MSQDEITLIVNTVKKVMKDEEKDKKLQVKLQAARDKLYKHDYMVYTGMLEDHETIIQEMMNEITTLRLQVKSLYTN